VTPTEWPRETYAAKQLAVVTAVVDALPGVAMGVNLWEATSTLPHVQIRVYRDVSMSQDHPAKLAANLATLCALAQAIALPAPEHERDYPAGADPAPVEGYADWACRGELAGLLVEIRAAGPLADAPEGGKP
jgi:hypothetical protein